MADTKIQHGGHKVIHILQIMDVLTLFPILYNYVSKAATWQPLQKLLSLFSKFTLFLTMFVPYFNYE